MAPEQARGQGHRPSRRHLGLRLRALRDADRRSARSPARRSPTYSPRWCRASRTGTRCRPASRRQCGQLVRRCLQKDPRKRLRDIGEARVVLEADHNGSVAAATARSRRPFARLAVDDCCRCGRAGRRARLVGVYVRISRSPRATAPATVTLFDVQAPDTASDVDAGLPSDDRAFREWACAGVRRCIRRNRSRLRSHARGIRSVWMVPGSDRGTSPALSPDGTSVAFFADGQIRKATLGGEPTSIGTAARRAGPFVGGRRDDGVDAGLQPTPMMMMPAGGGQMRPLTTLAARRADASLGLRRCRAARPCCSRSARSRAPTTTTPATSMRSLPRPVSGASSWPARRWRATAATAACSSRRAARCTRSASILSA